MRQECCFVFCLVDSRLPEIKVASFFLINRKYVFVVLGTLEGSSWFFLLFCWFSCCFGYVSVFDILWLVKQELYLILRYDIVLCCYEITQNWAKKSEPQ